MSAPAPARHEHWFRAVWRWHFYAGIFCVPFILWLSVTGGIYLFKPQIEGWLYAPYTHVAQPGVPMLAPEGIVAAGTRAVPGSVLHKYVLPEAPDDAVQLLVEQGVEVGMAEEVVHHVEPLLHFLLFAKGEHQPSPHHARPHGRHGAVHHVEERLAVLLHGLQQLQ